ncbi:MAG: GNAT family N-acetyltransferase [Chitinophagales bacterium]
MKINWVFKSFEELTNQELYDLLQLRAAVFVVEQDCAYQDLDGLDQRSLHLLGYHQKELVASARILPPQLKYPDAAAIGRVVTAISVRNKGIGKTLMQKAIAEARRMFPDVDIKISAQCYLDKFYKELGFKVISAVYLEDGIDHQEMILE